MTTVESLDDAKDFFVKIVEPSFNDIMSAASGFRAAFNAATALFHSMSGSTSSMSERRGTWRSLH